MANSMDFDAARTARLRKALEKAQGQRLEQFVFEGHALATGYAKYLVEYLETQLEKRK